MLFEGVQLHNVSELVPMESSDQQLCRFPETLREQLNSHAKRSATSCCGVEIRFRLLGDKAVVHLSLPDAAELTGGKRTGEIYFGCFQSGTFHIGAEGTSITVRYPENIELLRTLSDMHHLPFAADVVRILLPYSGQSAIQKVEGDVCPPRADDLPRKTLLIHGSSLTHGSSALHPGGTYAFRTAALLGMDLLNLGVAGGCMLEAEMADYIAGRNDWDVAMFELGINYQWDSEKLEFRSPELYQQRVDEFLPRIAHAHPDKWIFCTAFYQCLDDFYERERSVVSEYRAILKRKVEELAMPKLVYLPGEQMTPMGVAALSVDLVHPSAMGAVDLSGSLVSALKRYLF